MHQQRQPFMNQGIIVLQPNQYLSEIADYRFKPGIYHKSATGIGATEAELRADRDSILVFPSRSIAWTKSLTNQDYLYVGSLSRTEVVSDQDIQKYDYGASPKSKKILVVANSLKRVLGALGADYSYQKYFFFFDEIDKFQTESTFRSELEECIDFFLDPRCNGCLVTATLQSFSNPALAARPVTRIEVSQQQKPSITVAFFNHLEDLSIRVNDLISTYPDLRFVVAHKSVQKIKEIIGRLDLVNRKECGILCGGNSREVAEPYYVEFTENGKLPRRVNFMTAAYFSGIDITEEFALLIVSDESSHFSLMTRDEIFQIMGRGRKGLINATLAVENKAFRKRNSGVKALVVKAKRLREDSDKYLKKVTSGIVPDKKGVEQLKESIASLEADHVKLIRLNSTGEIVESFFTIDQYQNRLMQLREMYTTKKGLIAYLNQSLQIGKMHIFSPQADNSDDLAEQYITGISQRFELPPASSPTEKIIQSRAGKIRQYFLDVEEFKRFLRDTRKLTDTRFRQEYYKLVLLVLRPESAFRQMISEGVEIGKVYSGEEMRAIVTKAWKTCTITNSKPLIAAKELLSLYYRISDRRTSVRNSGHKQKHGWKVLGPAEPAYQVYSSNQDLLLLISTIVK